MPGDHHRQLRTGAGMLAQQPVEGFQGHGPGMETFIDEADAAQPQGFAALTPTQADTTGAEDGDITLTR
jgi:hypothetical protein